MSGTTAQAIKIGLRALRSVQEHSDQEDTYQGIRKDLGDHRTQEDRDVMCEKIGRDVMAEMSGGQ